MASIEKRSNNTYRITVSCGYSPEGKKLFKKKTVTIESTLTERQKEKRLNELAVLLEREVQSGTYLDGEKVTVREFAEKWLAEYAEKQLAPATIAVYKTRIEKRIIPALGHIRLSKLQPHHILEFYNILAEEGSRLDVAFFPATPLLDALITKDNKGNKSASHGVSRHTLNKIKAGNPTNEDTALKLCGYYGMDINTAFIAESKPLSDVTIRHHHRLLSAMLTTAVQWQLIDSNPAQRIKPPEVKQRKAQSYDDEQVLQLFEALENAPLNYRAMIYLVVYSGIRLSELAGLKWESLNLEAGTLAITGQRMYVAKYGTFEKDTKTESGVRNISLPSVVLDLLLEYRDHCTELRYQYGNLWEGAEPGTSFIFLGDMGKPMFPLRPSKWFGEFLQKNGLPKIVFHGLRHSHASLLIAEGVDIATVSERMGHSNKSVTLNTYSHAIKKKDRDATEKLVGLLDKNKSKSKQAAATTKPQKQAKQQRDSRASFLQVVPK